MIALPSVAPAAAPPFSPDGEPLCLPPAAGELCEAARRRMPEVESDLRRRLSGPDRSVEAVEMEALLSGQRSDRHSPVATHGLAGSSLNGHGGTHGHVGTNGHSGTHGYQISRPAGPIGDPLLESGVLALCVAHVLGRPTLVHLDESLALRGLKVSRALLSPDQPPRALDLIALVQHSGGSAAALHKAGLDLHDREHIAPVVEIYHASPASPAARALIALSAAGLARPVVLVPPGPRPGDAPAFVHAGLPADLLAIVERAFAPHAAQAASAAMQPLVAALAGRNPWLLHRIAEAPWGNGWPGGPALLQPQLTQQGLDLAHRTLGRPAEPDEAFALACQALSAALRLSDLSAAPLPVAPSTDAAGTALTGPILPPPDSSAQPDPRTTRLRAALSRLTDRPLLPEQDGEAPLFLRAALSAGVFVLDSCHPAELGRLLTLAGPGCHARLRLLHFPAEAAHALSVSLRHEDPAGRPVAWFVDGGDLRVHIELVAGGHLLRGT